MSKKKPASGANAKKKDTASLVRSSAAEYLTFIAASGQGGVEAVYADENVWLSQKMMGLLYDVETHTINYHLKKMFEYKELQENSVIRKFRITAADGKSYDTGHYNLSAVIAVGYKVNSERAVQFRKWATGIIESFTIKGFAMDDERLKNDGSVLGNCGHGWSAAVFCSCSRSQLGCCHVVFDERLRKSPTFSQISTGHLRNHRFSPRRRVNRATSYAKASSQSRDRLSPCIAASRARGADFPQSARG